MNSTNSYPSGAQPPRDSDAASLSHHLELLRQREQEMVELLGSSSPDRLMHDLRNLLNEVRLLRAITEDKG